MSRAKIPRIFVLQDELDKFEKGEVTPFVSAGLPEGEDDTEMYQWRGTIVAPAEGKFVNPIYNLKLYCGDKYPYEPPTIHFIHKINLPGVDPTNGRVDPTKFDLLNEWITTGNPQQHKKFCIASALIELRNYMSRNRDLPQDKEGLVYPCYKDSV